MNGMYKGRKLVIIIFTLLIMMIFSSENGFVNGQIEFNQNNVQSEFTNQSRLANVIVSIPSDYQLINPGDELLSSIKIVNLGGSTRVDVILIFELIDSQNITILTKKETLAIETQANLVRIFDIPEDADEAEYIMRTTLLFADGKTAVSDASFKVVKDKIFSKITLMGIIALVIILLCIIIYQKSSKWIEQIRLRARIRRIVRNRIKKVNE
jgi:uncharacterized membrane protein